MCTEYLLDTHSIGWEFVFPNLGHIGFVTGNLHNPMMISQWEGLILIP